MTNKLFKENSKKVSHCYSKNSVTEMCCISRHFKKKFFIKPLGIILKSENNATDFYCLD